MDRRRNPFHPGAGSPPPELAGRDELLERAAVALDRIRAGRGARSVVLYGLRGVGKTVLLTTIWNQAEAEGLVVVALEAPEHRSLPGMLVPALRTSLLRLDRLKRATAGVTRALRALAGFAKLKVHYDDLEMTLDVEPEPGLADSGDLGADLADLLVAVGLAAQERETVVVLAIDELQYVPEAQLAALIAALHRAGQRQLPITMIGAGLPQLLGQMGNAKSYAERLFEFVPVGPLDTVAATAALRLPVEREGEAIDDGAIAAILADTEGYPYFLQEWGKHCWDAATGSPIGAGDVANARELAVAELGPGPHRSGDIAAEIGREVTSLAPTRNTLIAKGMLFSPGHGDTAFTVPLFDAFMRRVMAP